MKKPIVRYCTYFNKNYLLKGLALHSSLVRHDPGAKLDILCMDDYTKNLLDKMALKGVTTIALTDFEDDELQLAKSNRSLVEYFWTCTPSLPRYVLKKHPNTELIFYLDADLYFYSSPKPIIKELGSNSIYIVEHRYPADQKHRDNISGRFNVAVNIFRNDKTGKACLERWRNQCNEWCYLKEEPGRFGDQLYLNEWPDRYMNTVISKNLGVDAAPWNIMQYKVRKTNQELLINNYPLIVYHFHQLEYYNPASYTYAHGYRFEKAVITNIYQPYIKELNKVLLKVKQIDSSYELKVPIKPISVKIKSTISKYAGPIYWRIRGIWQKNKQA